MKDPNPSDEPQLDERAQRELTRITGELRRLLLDRAGRLAEGRRITADDLDQAYSQLGFPNRELEDAQAIITRTLRENRVSEWVAYVMALVLFSLGIVLLLAGVFGSQDVTYRITSIVSGSVVELLLLVPFRWAINCRRHNIAIRMLGILIDRVDDPKKLTTLLKDTFLAVVVGNVPQDPA